MMNRILSAAHEALAIARGQCPAARLNFGGHAYVPAAELERRERAIQDALDVLARIKRGQPTPLILRYRDDAVAFLKIAKGEI